MAIIENSDNAETAQVATKKENEADADKDIRQETGDGSEKVEGKENAWDNALASDTDNIDDVDSNCNQIGGIDGCLWPETQNSMADAATDCGNNDTPSGNGTQTEKIDECCAQRDMPKKGDTPQDLGQVAKELINSCDHTQP